MFDITRKSIEWGGRTLSLESGRVARQADGAVMARRAETVIRVTLSRRNDAPGTDCGVA